MLVLSRKQGESIVIDGRITIKVLEVKGNRIRLGMEAPADVPIRRTEIPPFSTVGNAEGVASARTA